MNRHFVVAGCVVMLTAAAWAVGLAQGRVADFYMTVDAPVGEVKVTCSKGCEWPAEAGSAAGSIVYKCASQPCRLMFNGNGRITLGQPLARE